MLLNTKGIGNNQWHKDRIEKTYLQKHFNFFDLKVLSKIRNIQINKIMNGKKIQDVY